MAITVGRAEPFEHEFVKSFLNRPSLLSNSSILSSFNQHNRNEPRVNLQNGRVTLSLYIDNWTTYVLKVPTFANNIIVLTDIYYNKSKTNYCNIFKKHYK